MNTVTPRQLRVAYNQGKVLKCKKYHNEAFSLLGYHFTTSKRNKHYLFDNDHGTWEINKKSLWNKMTMIITKKVHVIP